MKKMHVKKGDEVLVITGDDKGKKGKILKAMPSLEKVIVEGVNIKKKFLKKTQQKKGSIIEKEFPIHVSNVKKVS